MLFPHRAACEPTGGFLCVLAGILAVGSPFVAWEVESRDYSEQPQLRISAYRLMRLPSLPAFVMNSTEAPHDGHSYSR
jgi:hypothetical protein